MIEPLVARSATEDLEPRLVESIPTFANGGLVLATDGTAPYGRLVATFHLLAGLAWHDGQPLTADDVAFAFEQDRGAPIGSPLREIAERMEAVDALDSQTVRVAYRAGERWDLYALAPRALPRHLLSGPNAIALSEYAARPIHAGPYRIASRVPGRVELEAFSGYARGVPRLPRIVVRFYPDSATLLAALRAHEIDIAPSPSFEADIAGTLERTIDPRDVTIRYKQSQAVATLRFGQKMAEPLVREAVALTVDRERIVRSVFAGRVRVPTSYLVAPLWAAVEGDAVPPPDRTTAKALMAQAGFHRGDLGIAERADARLVIALLVPAGSPGLSETARGIAVDIAILGIAAQVTERPAAEIDQLLHRGTFDLALVVEQADDPLFATEHYRGAVSPWFDALADGAREVGDRAEERALYGETQRLWTEAVAGLPMFQLLKVDAVAARLDGVRQAAHSAPLTWNVASWRIVPPR